jgi:hypothetical protein
MQRTRWQTAPPTAQSHHRRALERVIDIDDIRSRFGQAAEFLDETRRLFAANEALAHGYGGVRVTAATTGLASSTINRGIRELRSASNPDRKPDSSSRRRAQERGDASAEAGLPTALESADRGCHPRRSLFAIRWVSRSLRQLVKALAAQGFKASQRVVANLLRDLEYSCPANRKIREGGKHPDRDAQFANLNATVKAALTAGVPAISVDTKKKNLVGDFKKHGWELRPKGQPEPGAGA